MQFLAARRIGQQCHADKASRPGEMNTAQVRTALDMLVKRLTQLAMEQDTSRMRSAGEGTRERRLALEFHGRHLRPMVAVVKLCLPNEIQLSSIRLHPQFLARLRAAADDLVASFTGRATQRSMRTAASSSLKEEVTAARKAVALLIAMTSGEPAVPSALVIEGQSAIRTIEGGRSSGARVAPIPVGPAVTANAA